MEAAFRVKVVGSDFETRDHGAVLSTDEDDV